MLGLRLKRGRVPLRRLTHTLRLLTRALAQSHERSMPLLQRLRILVGAQRSDLLNFDERKWTVELGLVPQLNPR